MNAIKRQDIDQFAETFAQNPEKVQEWIEGVDKYEWSWADGMTNGEFKKVVALRARSNENIVLRVNMVNGKDYLVISLSNSMYEKLGGSVNLMVKEHDGVLTHIALVHAQEEPNLKFNKYGTETRWVAKMAHSHLPKLGDSARVGFTTKEGKIILNDTNTPISRQRQKSK